MLKILDIIRSFLPSLENLPALSSFSGFGPGWLFGALGAVMASVFGLSMGRTKAIVSLLSIYVAFAFEKLFPFLNYVKIFIGDSVEEYWLKTSIFLASYLLVFLIFNFSFIRKRLSSAEYSLFGIVVLSVLQFGLVVSIIFNFIPISLTSQWFPLTYGYFSTPVTLFMWAVAPLPVLLFIKK